MVDVIGGVVVGGGIIIVIIIIITIICGDAHLMFHRHHQHREHMTKHGPCHFRMGVLRPSESDGKHRDDHLIFQRRW